MPRNKPSSLTTPDLVLLSLLAERPMHGYQANTELERREWRDQTNGLLDACAQRPGPEGVVHQHDRPVPE